MIKKLSAILLSLIFLASCGKAISPEIGSYTCKQITRAGKKLSVGEYFSAAPVLTLEEKDKATLEINGEICEGLWQNSSGEFTLIIGEKKSVGTLENGICSVDLFGQGIVYSFFPDSLSSPVRDKGEKEKNNRWCGDWYGTWGLWNASGEWENLDGQFFDCFAHIDMGLDNSGEITLWDEKSSRSAPLAAVSLKLASSPTHFGIARSESGYFLSGDIEKGEWTIEPDREELENAVSFSSHYNGTDGEFDYAFFLRPWGWVWDDAIKNGSVRLPYHYQQWYLPMLSGNFPMPDSFDTILQ